MSLKQQKIIKFSPVQQEYFHIPQGRVYKECNRYRIAEITLENYGLKINNNDPRSIWSTPRVWSHDIVAITTPNENIDAVDNKPFCCTHCGSEQYIKYGKKNGKQHYMCKSCNRKFVDNLFFEKLKASPKIICLTLDLYFKGISLRKIVDHLRQFYDLDIHFTTIYYWIKKYIEIMDNYVSQFKPKLGIFWNTDETMVQINGEWFYLWNVIDETTRFHLASVISKERKIKDARKVFQVAKKKSHGDKPKFIITDGLGSYNKAINKEFHTVKKETEHITNIGIRGKKTVWGTFDNNLIERLQGTIKDRNKTQRGLKSEETTFVKGHQLYYNFIRPHEGCNGYTPAHFANIYLDLGNRKWKNLLLQSVKNQKEKDNSNSK